MGIFSGTSTEWLSVHCFQVELEFGNVGFCGGKKTGVPEENLMEQGREPTTNSTHILHYTNSENQTRECSHHCAISEKNKTTTRATVKRKAKTNKF